MHKKRLANMLAGAPEEVDVWHGTGKTNPCAIYEDQQDGFMMQYCSSGMWGRGIYFAENASYSRNYSFSQNGCHEFLLTRLLVGDAVHIMPSNPNLKFPPEKPGSRIRYNTVTGITGGSKVYIVYENGRAYPNYRVVYQL